MHAQLLHVLNYISTQAFDPFSIISVSHGVARAGGMGDVGFAS
jgi:hypothetical protein